MSIARRTALATVICCGFAFGCSDPTPPTPDPSKVPKAVGQADAHPQALPNTQLASKPVEPAPIGDAAPGVVASAEITPWGGATTADADSKVSGAIQFASTTTGLEVSGALKNLPKGLHGLHIHENGDCSNPGGHFAPAIQQHGDPASGEHHLGDLGNVEADGSNQAAVSINASGLALHGQNSILGHALVVHAAPDDLHSQPAGNSGDIIGCGIIAAHGDSEVRPENREEAAG
jgi:Cu-Zn family superoxide dismutase